MMQSTISTPATAMTPVVKYSVQRSGWSNWTAPAGGRRGRTTKKTQSTGVAASQRRGQPSGTGAPTELFFFFLTTGFYQSQYLYKRPPFVHKDVSEVLLHVDA